MTDQQSKQILSGSYSVTAQGISRRAFLSGVSGLVLANVFTGPRLAFAEAQGEYWVSAISKKPAVQGGEGSFGLGWLASDNKIAADVPAGYRGHAVLQHPKRKSSMLFLARRPGVKGFEIDLQSSEIAGEFHCAPQRHLFGHGCFSSDGSVLYTAEANLETGQGLVVLRDADTYQVLEEWPSHGIGPHDMQLMPDGKTLVVANGGLQTRPETGREVLNLDNMDSSLTYIDSSNGDLIGQYRLSEPKSSIRHLDVASDGTVAFAIQLQRKATGHSDIVPLTGIHKPEEELRLFEAPEALLGKMNDYVGSVAISEQSRLAGFASPRGNIAVFWHIDSGQLAGYHRLQDVCGIAVSEQQNAFVLSNSFGELRELDVHSLAENKQCRIKIPNYRWDNHLLIASHA